MILKKILFAAAASVIASATPLLAQSTLYFGGGINNNADELERDDTPFVVGILAHSPTGNLLIGGDIAGEGEMLDSTYGTNAIRQAFSFNGLIGSTLSQSQTTKVDAAFILGVRETFSDCPDSFLGYQCYADEPPETEYTFNYGALVSISFNNIAVGLRMTEVSTMATVGFSF